MGIAGKTKIMGNNFELAQFSLFPAGINKPTSQKPFKHGTLKDVYEWMVTPKMMELTQELRSIKDEKMQKDFKASKLPFVTFSGTFEYRNAKGLIKHSGLQCFDFDHLESKEELWNIKKLLLSDPYFSTEMMFRSPRGNGIKWVTHIDLERGSHEKWYVAIRNYLKLTYNLEADPLPSNVASACFLCWDPNLIINQNVAPY